MPHVVIEGEIDLAAFARDFVPRLLRIGADVARADRVYLTPDRRAALVEALVVEAGRKQPFYVKLAAHDRGSLTVRIDPLTHPERSEAVKAIVAALAADLLERHPQARVRVTNLVLPSGAGGSHA